MDKMDTYRQQVAAAILLVRQGSENRISLEDLASAAGVSPFHFDRVFRRMTGMAAVRYVRWFRLNRSAIELVRSDRPVIDIALAAGYSNHESFSRAFRVQFKTSPRTYRKQRTVRPQPFKDTSMKNLGISFGFVKIPVTDFAKSTAFYREVLGLEEHFAVEQYSWAQYGVGDAAICLYVPGMGAGGGPPGIDTGIQLRVTDALAAHALLTQRGGKPSHPQKGDDGTVLFDIADPDGNVLSIAQVPT
jgi:AraC-like DNA-binding protein/catechol 2,3-dioxygenase-like lactoylglutathione lyase family enzyme